MKFEKIIYSTKVFSFVTFIKFINLEGDNIKASNYNFFFPSKKEIGKLIAYNAMSNSLALIEEEKYKEYVDFLENKSNIKDENLISDLKKGSFIIDDNVDEKSILRFNMYNSRFDKRSFDLTIAPTSDCNFRCIYCYEKKAIKDQYMTRETERSIINWLKNKTKTIESFSVTWYGGEPLLAMDTIERLSKEFIDICTQNNLFFSSSIITNGYLLTNEILNKLKECKVTFMQVTVDGTEEYHNKRRPLKDGKPTFKTIINNLSKLKDNLIEKTSLRVNVDTTNHAKVEDIINILKEKKLEDKVSPYIGLVCNSNDCYLTEKCMSNEEYSRAVMSFEDKLKKETKFNELRTYPVRVANSCGSDSINTYVVDSNGDLYKCWDDIGNKKTSIGNVNNLDCIEANETFLDYMLYDPTEDDKCKECKYLPICMGGCPFKRINNNMDRCLYIKEHFETYFERWVEQLRQNQKVEFGQ